MENLSPAIAVLRKFYETRQASAVACRERERFNV